MRDELLYSMAEELGGALLAANRVVTTAESCTGGWIAKCLTDVPGSSAWFERGLVTYGNEAKSDWLGVQQTLLDTCGAVSAEVARAMAESALHRAKADLSVAVSGIAGPEGGSAEKPVGTVWLAWAQREDNSTRCDLQAHCFRGNREAVRRQAVAAALRGLIDLAEK